MPEGHRARAGRDRQKESGGEGVQGGEGGGGRAETNGKQAWRRFARKRRERGTRS